MDHVKGKRDHSFPEELLCILREKNTPETAVHHRPKDVPTRSWEFSCKSRSKTERLKGKKQAA